MDRDNAPPSGPPPSYRAGAPSTADYAPPPGPPPSHYRAEPGHDYAPPPGPPPSHDKDDYAPPPGPPPSRTKKSNNPFFDTRDDNTSSSIAPPPPPPPPQDWETAVPDTALLPPPPDYFGGFDRSPANNATEEEADAGERWCRDFPLYEPAAASSAAALAAAADRGQVTVFAPPLFFGGGGTLAQVGPGVWRGSSPPGGRDVCLATYPPLYSARVHAPMVVGGGGGRTKTIYYEVRILADGRGGGGGGGGRGQEEVPLALGFAAPPYPPFRLPGWHRASLGVHGDDGRRFVNDTWGGHDFARPFRRGETVGLGMRFAAGAAGLGVRADVFLTRDGREAGRWDLHEETDLAADRPVAGLEGASRDLCAAVGVFGPVAFEVVFRPDLWAWKGPSARAGQT